MKYMHLGDSGLRVSRVAIGSWLTIGSALDARQSESSVRRALDAGVNLVDTADIYAFGEAERTLGATLAPVRRSSVVLATKLYWPMSEDPNDRGLSRKHIVESIEGSLRRLRTDYVDLYQCHRYDADTPLHETVRAMGDLIRAGKVLYWGVSCWTAAQIEDACAIADTLGVPRPISNQPPYSLLERGIEAAVIPTSTSCGLSQIVFSPLAQGVLSGKYRGGERPVGSRGADERRGRFMQRHLVPETLARVDRFVDLASAMGTTPSRLALAFCLRTDDVASVIFGASSAEQVDENVGAVDVELDDTTVSELERLFPPGPASHGG